MSILVMAVVVDRIKKENGVIAECTWRQMVSMVRGPGWEEVSS